MQKELVNVVVDINGKWSGNLARYRCYVNDELFTERTWIWTDCHLEEVIPIYADPGRYQIRYELVDPENIKIKLRNFRILNGSATIDQKGNLHITGPCNENT
jgi:glutamine cyclotransferase